MLLKIGAGSDNAAAQRDIAPQVLWNAGRAMQRPQWTAAIRLYHQDQVAEAYEVASSVGAGDRAEFAENLQILDAEARTSSASSITRINDWLEVEVISAQQSLTAPTIGEIAEKAIRQVWAKIGLRVGVDTLITLLDEGVVLPSHLDPTGYVTLKKPYAKYCLPAIAAQDELRLGVQIQMIGACHAAAILSASAAPAWLIAASEALSDIVVSNEVRYGFCSGGVRWREPGQLSRRLKGLDADENPVQSALYSLDQAVLIGKYLIEKGGIKAFRDLLTYHDPSSVIQYFVLLFSNDPTRDACKKLFGFAPEYLFEQSLAACCK